MFQKLKQKLQFYNNVYIDYFLINSLLSLILFKLNKITFHIPFIYLFIGILLFVILFKNYFLIIGNKIKNTYFFNFILFNDLLIKEFIYSCIFTFIENTAFDKNTKIYLFFFFFTFSYYLTAFLFYIGFYFNLFFFFLLLFVSILNLIENQYIFSSQNIKENQLENLNFNSIQKILNIKNTNFNRNQNLFYIQKRYVHFTELRQFLQKNGLTILSSTVFGTLFTGYLQHNSVQVQKDQLIIQKDQLIIQKDQLEFDKRQAFESLINNETEKITKLNKKIHKLQVNMDTTYFWNKVNHKDMIEELKNELVLSKRRRDYFEKQKFNENIQAQSLSLKKQQSSLDDSTINLEEISYTNYII
jgi:hypothetical protein